MPQAPTLTPHKPLTVRLLGSSPTAKFPMCITFPPDPGVNVSLPTSPYTEFRYSPEFQPGVCVLHPGETMERFAARVESVSAGAYVILTIDLNGKVEIIEVVISRKHPYLAQTEYNHNLLAKMATETVEEALRLGALVIKRKQ